VQRAHKKKINNLLIFWSATNVPDSGPASTPHLYGLYDPALMSSSTACTSRATVIQACRASVLTLAVPTEPGGYTTAREMEDYATSRGLIAR
jgi:hypothetical protein